MKTIVLGNYEGVEVESGIFEPFIHKQQVAVYSKSEPIKDGDYVYACINKGKGEYDWLFKKASMKKSSDKITLSPIGPLDSSKPITGLIGGLKIILAYRITAIETHCN